MHTYRNAPGPTDMICTHVDKHIHINICPYSLGCALYMFISAFAGVSPYCIALINYNNEWSNSRSSSLPSSPLLLISMFLLLLFFWVIRLAPTGNNTEMCCFFFTGVVLSHFFHLLIFCARPFYFLLYIFSKIFFSAESAELQAKWNSLVAASRYILITLRFWFLSHVRYYIIVICFYFLNFLLFPVVQSNFQSSFLCITIHITLTCFVFLIYIFTYFLWCIGIYCFHHSFSFISLQNIYRSHHLIYIHL